MALTKFNFNSFDLTTAASTGIAFNASANGLTTAEGGALNLITTNTISSGVSSSSFTSGIDSTYDIYMFKWINIHPATNSVYWEVNFRDGGSSFDATKTSTFFRTIHNESDSETKVDYESGDDLAQGTGYQRLNTGVGNGADESVSGTMFLFSPSNTTFVKHFLSESMSHEHDDYTNRSFVGGYCNVTAAIDGLDFKFSSGNIDSGVIKMYGITK